MILSDLLLHPKVRLTTISCGNTGSHRIIDVKQRQSGQYIDGWPFGNSRFCELGFTGGVIVLLQCAVFRQDVLKNVCPQLQVV